LMEVQMLSTLHDILDYTIEKGAEPGPQLDEPYGTDAPRGTAAASR
jgi:hypothetical protein